MSKKSLRKSPSGKTTSAKTTKQMFVGYPQLASLAQTGNTAGFDFADVVVKEGSTIIVTGPSLASQLMFKGELLGATTPTTPANIGVVAANVGAAPFDFPVEGLTITVEVLLA